MAPSFLAQIDPAISSPPLTTAAPAQTVVPENLTHLQELVCELHASGSPWIPSGLGSRLAWGPALSPATVISTRQCCQVIDHAADDLTITVQAGLPLIELQAVLAEHNQWFPVDWPWGTDLSQPASAGTVGGLVARGLAGSLRQRHLGVRDQIIGIGLIRSDGVEAHAGGRVVKNVAGYDLMRLLCGSWGSLALISELTLRVQPIRPARALLQLHGNLPQLEAWRAAVVASTLTPELLQWQSSPDQPLSLQVGIASVSDAAVDDQLNRLEALAGHHQLSAERHPWEGPLPAAVPAKAITSTTQATNSAWLVRLSLPPTQIAPLLQSPENQQLHDWHWHLAAGAGCGDGWSPTPLPAYQLEALRRRVQSLGGQLTLLLQPAGRSSTADTASATALPAWLDAPSKPLIEAVKRQFDPRQQLCRGRLPGVADPLSPG